MTKAKYSDIVKKNEAVRRFMKFGRSKNGKIKVTVMKHAVIVKTSEKGFMINKAGLPVKMTVSNGFTERCQIKEEIKRVHKGMYANNGVRLLSVLVEKDIRKHKKNTSWGEFDRFWAYENIYEIAFSRGVRHERQRRKKRDNIGALTGDDIAELAQAMHVDINKVNTALLEITASRKQVVHEI